MCSKCRHLRPLSLFGFAWLVFSMLGCDLLYKKPNSYEAFLENTRQRVYYAPYEKVWRAAHAAIAYSIALENQDTGVIETDSIRGADGWFPPEVERPKASGLRYRLVFNLIKGRIDGREATKVNIEKKIEILRDFFSEPESDTSDGLEERSIYYRIERELIISGALKKAAELGEL